MRLLSAVVTLALLSTQAQAAGGSVSGTDGSNALGTLPCAAIAGQPIRNCHAELIRRDAQNVTINVLLPTGETRNIYFTDGEPTASNSTAKITSEVQGDVMRVFIEPGEVFQISTRAVANQ